MGYSKILIVQKNFEYKIYFFIFFIDELHLLDRRINYQKKLIVDTILKLLVFFWKIGLEDRLCY